MAAHTSHTHLVGQDDEESLEDGYKVEEEIDRVPHVVVVTVQVPLHNHLSVKQDQATENEQPKVDLDLGGRRRREGDEEGEEEDE